MANKDGDDGKVNSSQEETKTIFSDQIPTAFSDPFSTLFDTPSESHDPQIKTSTLGFIDMLEIQDYTPSIFDMIQSSTPLPPPPPPPLPPQPTELASPSGNSTNSISSISSTEMMAPQTGEEQEQEQDQDQEEKSNSVTMSTKHDQLKPKKKNTKRQRQPRFAFMTKSDVDHLDDGYRWRKYGQKAVKNSPYPRSYYRCTMASCGVKKRVERSSQDSTIVVTTYEGTHGHPCPVTLRTTTTITSVGPPESATFLGGGLHFPAPNSPNFINIINPSSVSTSMLSPPQPFNTTTNPLIFDEYYNYNNCPPFSSSQSSSSSSSMVRDHGLLQDMIMPSQVRKESEDHDHHTS